MQNGYPDCGIIFLLPLLFVFGGLVWLIEGWREFERTRDKILNSLGCLVIIIVPILWYVNFFVDFFR